MRRSSKKYNRVKCSKCGKEISKSNIRKHEKKCKKLQQEEKSEKKKIFRTPPRGALPESVDTEASSEDSSPSTKCGPPSETVDDYTEKLIVDVSREYKKRFHLFLEKKCDIKWLQEASNMYHKSIYCKVIENGGDRQTYYRILKCSSLAWGKLEIRLLKLFTYKMRTCAGSWIQKNYKQEALDYLLKLQECIPLNKGFSLDELYSIWSGPNMAIFGPIELMQCTSIRFSQVCRCKSTSYGQSGFVRLRDSGLLPNGVWVEDWGWRETLKNLTSHALQEGRKELTALLGEIMVTKEPPARKGKFVEWFNKTWVKCDDFQYQDEVINLFESLYYLNELDQEGDPLFFSLFVNKMNLTWVVPISENDQIFYNTHKVGHVKHFSTGCHSFLSGAIKDGRQSIPERNGIGFATWTDFFCRQGSSFHQRNTFQWFIECYKKLRGERAVVLK